MANWIAWIPIVLLALFVPFSIWVRRQVRKGGGPTPRGFDVKPTAGAAADEDGDLV